MLRKEECMSIRSLHGRCVYHKDIALELGVHPKTVGRALKRGSAPRGLRRRRSSKPSPFKATVDRLLGEGVWNAVVILREIQAEGYLGGKTTLRQYIPPKRALRPGRATVRFETEPGKQMQSNWGEIETRIAGEPTKVRFLVNHQGSPGTFTSGAPTGWTLSIPTRA
jgi:transposase